MAKDTRRCKRQSVSTLVRAEMWATARGPGDLATGPNLARKPYYYGLAIVARSLRGCESSWSTLRWRKLLDLTNETDKGRTRGLHTADLEISKL